MQPPASQNQAKGTIAGIFTPPSSFRVCCGMRSRSIDSLPIVVKNTQHSGVVRRLTPRSPLCKPFANDFPYVITFCIDVGGRFSARVFEETFGAGWSMALQPAIPSTEPSMSVKHFFRASRYSGFSVRAASIKVPFPKSWSLPSLMPACIILSVFTTSFLWLVTSICVVTFLQLRNLVGVR